MLQTDLWPAAQAHTYVQAGLWQQYPLHYWVWQHAMQHPHQLALICQDRYISYGQLWHSACRLAACWQRQGLRAGQTALIQLDNCAEYYVVLHACWLLGIIPVSALYRHGVAELTAFAMQIKPELWVLDNTQTLTALPSCLSSIPHKWQHVVSRANPAPAEILSEQQHDLAIDSPLLWPQSLPSLSSIAMVEFARQTRHTAHDAETQLLLSFFHDAPRILSSVALLQLSGGSTGIPKLIPRTHNDYAYSIRTSTEVCGWHANIRYLCALPAGHNFALSSPGALGAFYVGGCVVMAKSPEALHCFDLIKRHDVSWAALVPAAALLWLTTAATNPAPRFAVLQIGGAMISPSLAEQLEQQFGCVLQQVYGMAEGLVNYTALQDPPAWRWHYQGRPMSRFDEIRICDTAQQPVPFGSIGELQTRGPYTICRYWQGGEQNFTPDGFYRTGDLVRQGPDGLLQVMGRVKDQINRGGEKFAAAEIEQLLQQHPAVQQAALLSVPDEYLGEKSLAVVVLKPQLTAIAGQEHLPHTAINANAIPADAKHGEMQRHKVAELNTTVAVRRYVRQAGVAAFKIPDHVLFCQALPLTAVGKVDKPALFQLWLASQPSTFDASVSRSIASSRACQNTCDTPEPQDTASTLQPSLTNTTATTPPLRSPQKELL